MDNMRSQAQRFGAETQFKMATVTDLSKRPFEVQTDDARYTGDVLIISTGASARHWVSSRRACLWDSVSACATCDGFFFRDKEVVVVGGGDSAMKRQLT